MAENEQASPHHLPVQLTRRLTPMRYLLPLENVSHIRTYEMESAIRDWFLGESCRLLDFLSVRIEYNDSPHSPFRTRFLEDRLHHLKTFYDRALTRYRNLRGDNQHIAQDELDDLVVKAAF